MTMNARKTARALGWFSIALGLVELLAPKRLGKAVGMPDRPGLLRAYGLREIASGALLLARPRKAPWVWARVGGDALDLATLGAALARGGTRRPGTWIATLLVLGVTVIDVLCGRQLARQRK